MKFYFRGREIHDKTEWKNAFCAAYKSNGDDIHWKEGRSGERLAEDFIGITPDGTSTIKEMVKRFLKTDNVFLDYAEIEHASRFDCFPKPRMQDLAIWGEADGKKVFIGVEAKVDESFGSKTIKEQRDYVNKLKEKGCSTQADKRLDKLVTDFLSGHEEINGALMYQLLYYLAGSVREKDANIVFMPVIVYKSNLYSEYKGKKNKDAYEHFMRQLGFTDMPGLIKDKIELAFHKRLSVDGFIKDVYSCYIVK